MGRFLNADGQIGEVGEILGHNLFAYCQNNPVMNIDPSGYAWYNPFSWSNETKIIVGAAFIVVGIAATVVTGGAQIASAGFKVAAKAGVTTGRKGGIYITKNIKILSPNHKNFYENGGT